MKKALVLGGGVVGSAMAMDMAAQGFAVTVADMRAQALERVRAKYGVATAQADLSESASVGRLVASYDIVLGALSSPLGHQSLRAAIEAGKDCCDVSFMPENAHELDDLARERGVTAIVDCGVAPGMSNMIAGYATTVLSPCESIEIYVGGLPAERRWPHWYKAPLSTDDVLGAYTRPARVVERGEIVVKEALSEPELVDFPGVGTVEAVNTDGLRSLPVTLKVPFMKQKTLRWPGHIDLMRALRETGLFSNDPVDVKGTQVRPLDLTSQLLASKWTFDDGEPDLTVMRISATGQRDGAPLRLTWDLLDRYDPKANVRSMARTTAFPATIVAGMIARGTLKRPGVHAPEVLGREPGFLDEVLSELGKRAVTYLRS